ncbi:ferric reductase like transmembrane component-domain-containing protein [Thelonectria olida]|uniref:Ferric reductase like transmembrane component-domain-containing protein n=1 Tax=Thelonectria olida TaxID=1576542 RepID=A0A9P8W880_9HYPO|nr:ferric reductase like transmembrane component-domain-containing protein [Thelonectria olida]
MAPSTAMRFLPALAVFFIPIALYALTIGLTYAEDYLPQETRYHLAIFYGMLILLSFALFLRLSSRYLYILSDHQSSTGVPLLRKYVAVGGAATTVLITAITLATTALWLPAHLKYWGDRADSIGWTSTKIRLTVTGVTGHYADILLGILIIPVSRNNLVGRAFRLQQSTLLFAHKVVAYLFFMAVLAHGVAYAMYALDSSGDGDEDKTEAFSTGNPTMTLHESESRSSWYGNTTYTGVAAFIIIVIITITASAFIRRRNYNLFYYSHLICGMHLCRGRHTRQH